MNTFPSLAPGHLPRPLAPDSPPGARDRGEDGVATTSPRTGPTPTATALYGVREEVVSRFTGEAVPLGVDPELWSVLTREERMHFAGSGEIGTLTYGRRPSSQGEVSPARGVRLDVRV